MNSRLLFVILLAGMVSCNKYDDNTTTPVTPSVTTYRTLKDSASFPVDTSVMCRLRNDRVSPCEM